MRKLFLLAALCVIGGACASAGTPGPNRYDEFVEVRVDNLYPADVTVYVKAEDGRLTRLGTAVMGQPTTFYRRLPLGKDLYFILDPVGQFGKVEVQNRVPASATSNGLRLQITRELHMSTWMTL